MCIVDIFIEVVLIFSCHISLFFRTSDSNLNLAYELMMQQLHIKHAEVRMSVCQMVNELFNRSHVFRELLIEDLQTFLDLTTGSVVLHSGQKKNPVFRATRPYLSVPADPILFL